MRTEPDKGLVSVTGSLGRREGNVPLARIGSGLAVIYRDVVTAPLPPDLQRLADRLEHAARDEGTEGQGPAE